MELPQQAVNALIQRTTESSSESESRANPGALYANSLLQQFVAQTQMLNAPSAAPPATSDGAREQPNEQVSAVGKDAVKRKRGRPKKTKARRNAAGASEQKAPPVGKQGDFCGNPNVSPDSGIQNSPEHVSSPEPNPSVSLKNQTNTRKRHQKVFYKLQAQSEPNQNYPKTYQSRTKTPKLYRTISKT